jgi:hypothetical protein
MAAEFKDKTGTERLRKKDVVILSGAAVSSAVMVGGGKVVGFLCPATIANAAYDVQTSWDNSTYYDVTGMQSVAAYVSTVSSINPAYSMACGPYVRLQGTSNESADRTFTILYEAV